MSDTETDDLLFHINSEINSEIIKVKIYNNGNEYKILNYDKQYVCFNDIETFKYRSIILSHPEQKILSFSPPKSLDYNNFINDYKDINDNIYANEYIEGTMINLFYDERIEKWEISTKSAVGGNYFYYRNYYSNIMTKQKTFYQMFINAFRLDDNKDISDIFILNELSKKYCYSFVLQHPDNHIVLDIKEPRIFLVSVYETINKNKVKYIPIPEVQKWKCFSSGIIEFPKQYVFNCYDELSENVLSIQNPSDFIGVVITDLNTGYKTKIENPSYRQKKFLRGNNPNLQYQYLCLYRVKKINDFLNYFPRYVKLFKKFYYDYNEFVSNVHLSYLYYYVQKNQVIISKQYLPHIYKIHHEIYLPSIITGDPIIIRRKVVKDYFDNMEPRELLYHLNYSIRTIIDK